MTLCNEPSNCVLTVYNKRIYDSYVVKTQAPKTKTETHDKELVKDNLLYQDTNQSTVLTATFVFISLKSKVLCCPKNFAKTCHNKEKPNDCTGYAVILLNGKFQEPTVQINAIFAINFKLENHGIWSTKC